MTTFKDTFNKLSQIDVNEHTEKKGQFTYLSWTWAWKTLVENTENASFVWNDDKFFQGGTMEVSINLTVDGHTLPMWGAVTDYKNQAIQNPDSHSINTARMRCLVKAMAMFGLGHYIYAGESFPEDVESNGAQLPANSYASPKPENARSVEPLKIEESPVGAGFAHKDSKAKFEPEPDAIDVDALLKLVPKVGYAKGKKTYGECLDSLMIDITYWGSRSNLTEDQKEHLSILRTIKTYKALDNQGVLS